MTYFEEECPVSVGGKRLKIEEKLFKSPQARKKIIIDSDQSEDNNSTSSREEEENIKQITQSRKAQRDLKSQLIAQILCRWWYVFPQWPPPDFDYNQALLEKGLKAVALQDWEAADDVDEYGLRKVYELSHSKGVYRDPKGNAIDLRPIENKPCYSNLKSYTELELYGKLVEAIRNQLSCIDKSPYWNTEAAMLDKLKSTLKEELRNAEKAFVEHSSSFDKVATT